MNNMWPNLGRNEMATREADRRNAVEVPRELEHRKQVQEALKGRGAAQGRGSRMRTAALLLAVLILIAIAVAVALVAGR